MLLRLQFPDPSSPAPGCFILEPVLCWW